MKLSLNLIDQIYFVSIGRYKRDDTYFQWKCKDNPKVYFFDIQSTRFAPEKRIFYCVSKEDKKLVYFVKKMLFLL